MTQNIHVTQRDGQVEVLTFKEGLLSKVAHDLRLRLGEFEVEIETSGRVAGHFSSGTLRVEGAVHDGEIDASRLTDRERREIESNIFDKILKTRRHPSIVFEGSVEGSANGFRASGDLTLVGRRAPIEIQARRAGGRVTGEVELRPSRWGIAPFKALLGAIRLQDRVVVRFDLPAPDGLPSD